MEVKESSQISAKSLKILKNFQDYYAVEEMAHKMRLADHMSLTAEGNLNPYAEFIDDADNIAGDDLFEYTNSEVTSDENLDPNVHNGNREIPQFFHIEGKR